MRIVFVSTGSIDLTNLSNLLFSFSEAVSILCLLVPRWKFYGYSVFKYRYMNEIEFNKLGFISE